MEYLGEPRIVQAEFSVSNQMGLTPLQDTIGQKTTLAIAQLAHGWQSSPKPQPVTYPELRDIHYRAVETPPMEKPKHCATETEQVPH